MDNGVRPDATVLENLCKELAADQMYVDIDSEEQCWLRSSTREPWCQILAIQGSVQLRSVLIEELHELAQSVRNNLSRFIAEQNSRFFLCKFAINEHNQLLLVSDVYSENVTAQYVKLEIQQLEFVGGIYRAILLEICEGAALPTFDQIDAIFLSSNNQ